MSLREKLLYQAYHNNLNKDSKDVKDIKEGEESVDVEIPDPTSTHSPYLQDLLVEQRKLRVSHIKQLFRQFVTPTEHGKAMIVYPHIGLPLGIQSYISEAIPYNHKLRQRKAGFKDSQYWKKQEKQVTDQKKKVRKQKLKDFHEAMLKHRDEFLKFHKECRAGKIYFSVFNCF